MGQSGTAIVQTSAPTFAEGVIAENQSWTEVPITEAQVVSNGDGAPTNVNWLADPGTTVTVPMHPVGSAIAVGDTLTETNGGLRKWVVTQADAQLSGNIMIQNVTMVTGTALAALL